LGHSVCPRGQRYVARWPQVAMNEFTRLDGTPMKGSLQNLQLAAVATARLSY
jgi:hypothetical protein